ncbi:thioredoxin family protein [Candidatus Dependentiae bacterium]|nr:thioredoxin family protein [Candidatus Dependentiae bacterium]
MFKKVLLLTVFLSSNTFAANLVDLAELVKEKNTTPEAAFNETLKNNKLVVVEFYSPTCSHCIHMAPILKSVANEYAATEVLFLKVPDKYENIFVKYGVAGLPTFMYVKDGQKQFKRGGAISAQVLKDNINKYLGVSLN